MLSTALILTALAGVSLILMSDGATAAPQGADDKPVVVLDTTLGPITIELDRAKAPISVANFLKYVDKGFYDGLIFHRVIPDFMVQGGGMKEVDGKIVEQKDNLFDPIKNESGNGLSNARGTIAMARTSDPNSATAQFYINHGTRNAGSLDGRGPGTGYAVFGKVIAGMEVVDAIAKLETGVKSSVRGQPYDDVPTKTVVIKSAKRKTTG